MGVVLRGEPVRTPNVAHRTNDWQALAQLVAHRHGVALIPDSPSATFHLAS